MHELSITRNIVATCAEHAGERKVSAVKLKVGKLSGIEVQALRFCFDVCTKGTVLEGAELRIDEIAGRGECLGCGKDVAVERLVAICPCEKRARLNLVAGEELLIHAMEV
ncbi:MAG: hydrogenase maturation nickel metallochaperone HypA [Myxococcota bacterium]